jgi:undecaprenyl diphosphate synthase
MLHKRVGNALHSSATAPAHLGLIPDGNRRWARRHGLSLLNGYHNGIDRFISFSMWAKRLGVKTITVWALSTENIKNRSRTEVRMLYSLYMRAAKDPKLLALLVKNRARIMIVGNLSMLPSNLRETLRALEAKTMGCSELTINLLIGYGGKDDIMHATCVAARARSRVGEAGFSKGLRSSALPDVDLVIRTSGEHRLSGFLPWQTDYAELYFTRKYWPEFNRRDLKRAIDSYSSRERRFGK